MTIDAERHRRRAGPGHRHPQRGGPPLAPSATTGGSAMSRLLAVLALLFLALPASLRAARADDEPTLQGKTVSRWATLLREGKAAKGRRRGLLALGLIDVKKSRKVLPAVVTALREDPD